MNPTKQKLINDIFKSLRDKSTIISHDRTVNLCKKLELIIFEYGLTKNEINIATREKLKNDAGLLPCKNCDNINISIDNFNESYTYKDHSKHDSDFYIERNETSNYIQIKCRECRFCLEKEMVYNYDIQKHVMTQKWNDLYFK